MSARLGPDFLVVRTPRRWGAVGVLVAVLAGWALLVAALGPSSVPGLLLLGLGALGVPPALIAAKRLLTVTQVSVARAPGRLLVDGDPVELARVELHMRAWPFTQRPREYALSLWVLTSAGPQDLPLGTYRTLLLASQAAAPFEDFVQRANLKLPGATRAR